MCQVSTKLFFDIKYKIEVGVIQNETGIMIKKKTFFDLSRNISVCQSFY